MHNGRTLFDGLELPARVSTLDELLLVLPRDTPLRFEPDLGFHLYGPTFAFRLANAGSRSSCLMLHATITHAPSACRSRSSAGGTYSPGSGRIVCPWPRRAL